MFLFLQLYANPSQNDFVPYGDYEYEDLSFKKLEGQRIMLQSYINENNKLRPKISKLLKKSMTLEDKMVFSKYEQWILNLIILVEEIDSFFKESRSNEALSEFSQSVQETLDKCEEKMNERNAVIARYEEAD